MTDGPNPPPSARAVDQPRITEFFENHSADYSDFFDTHTLTGASELFRLRMAIVGDLLAGHGGAMLDAASGTGEITQAVNEGGAYDRVCANDVSAAMLEATKATVVAQRPGQILTFLNSDVFDLAALPDMTSFDVILCLGLIAHVGRLAELLSVLIRLLKPGGIIVLQTTVASHWGARLARLVHDRRVAMGRIHEIHHYDLLRIEAVATSVGLRVATVRRFGVCLPFGDRLMGRLNHRLERRFARVATRHGGEAILVLEQLP